jgi:hypothetical protein
MLAIAQMNPLLESGLPETYAILKASGLVVHPVVTQITLHGSRGLARNHRPDSDIDLSLLVSPGSPPVIDEQLGYTLREVITATLSPWRGPVEADLAVIFPLHPCGLACFQELSFHSGLCSLGGKDCFGIYKIQKGYSGFVLNAGIEVELIYPCVTVWKREL